MRAGSSWPVFCLFVCLCVATQAAYNLGDWWLSFWLVMSVKESINQTIIQSVNQSASHPASQLNGLLFCNQSGEKHQLISQSVNQLIN